VPYSRDDVLAVLGDSLIPQWREERRKLDKIDKWARWSHGRPSSPARATAEYRQLADRAEVPWGDLVVGSVAQTLYVSGYRTSDSTENAAPWRIWQANGMDSRQIPMHRAALMYGSAYGTALPGRTLTGDPMPTMRGVSPREMIALYEDPAWDEWPEVAMRVSPRRGNRFELLVFDDEFVHTVTTVDGIDGARTYEKAAAHGAGVCPVVRFVNRFDLEGRCAGEIEPFIPLFGSIDQTKFDRLVVQRFASWIVRTIAGMTLSESVREGETEQQAKLRLAAEDFLVAQDPDTKFGSLPATPLNGFTDAYDHDIKTLAAVSQTPAYEMTGMVANLNADAIIAAKGSQMAKGEERRVSFGESWEQFLRLASWIAGDTTSAADFSAEVTWQDTSLRSLAQAVDAAGKMVQMLGVPYRAAWEWLPGVTQQQLDQWEAMASQAGGIEALIANLADAQTSPALPAA